MKKINFWLLIILLSFALAACSSSKKTTTTKTTTMTENEKEKILVGDLAYEEIISTLPRWEEQDKIVELAPEEISRLSEVGRKIDVVCYLGTWCPDSRGAVPHFTRALEIADNPNISYKIIGLNRDKEDPQTQRAMKNDIQRVPTFLIYENGKEIGRLIEYPVLDNFVLDILDLLTSK
ncbi:MAG: thioredoxin family protein [Calditrichota bacterium]